MNKVGHIKSIAKDYDLLIKRGMQAGNMIILFESIVSDPSSSLNEMTGFCGLDNSEFVSFRHAFGVGCSQCGGAMSEKMSDMSPSRFLKRFAVKLPASMHFYCSRCKLVTLSYGGFNPHTEFQQIPRKPLENKLRNMLRRHLENHLGKEMMQKFGKMS